MKLKKSQIFSNVLMLGGFGLLIYLISDFGFDRILTNLLKTGFWFVPIFLTWGVVYIFNNFAWAAILRNQREGLSFGRMFLISVAAFSVNYVTPFFNLGGEPFRILSIKPYVGAKKAASSVILYNMMHQFSHLWIWVVGLLWFVINMPLDKPIYKWIILLSLCMIIPLMILFTRIFKKGMLLFLFRKFFKLRLTSKLFANLKNKENNIAEVDNLISAFYNTRKKDFYLSFAFEFIGRCISSLEFYFILRSINIDISFMQAFYINAATSIFVNLIFFIPMQVGTKEASLIFIMDTLRIQPSIGVYVGVVMRIREFFWIGIGLIFLKLSGLKRNLPEKGMLEYVGEENGKNKSSTV